ncbi:uncharacterized protein LOC123003717 [Tribolium madens]|uniref:uncharacterized protein LOC123003717 n=1 Tax=Tribolium madens TaxID=41895 RepID=UPI001CF7322C|nr:uncharacterized protein LOC123003717 [Tribolium madens]
MGFNRKLKNGAKKHPTPIEIDEILVDLKKVLHSLSTVTVRLEKSLSLYNLNESEEEEGFQSAEENVKVNSVSKRVNAFQKQSQVDIKSPILRSFRSLDEHSTPNEILVHSEKINQIVVNNNVAKNNVEHIKKKIELYSSISDSSSDEVDAKPTELNKIKVDVQSLKQKFEIENRHTPTYVTSSMIEVNRRKSVEEKGRQSVNKMDEKRRKSEEKPKKEKTFVEEDKVKRMLKYFQPTSK